jgi:hypothetical protein
MTELSTSIAALTAALVKAVADMKNPLKESTNPHFRSRYADLAAVRDAVVPVLARHGLAVMQMPTDVPGPDGTYLPALSTVLAHTSGEYVKSTVLLRPVKLDPQAIGSAVTYARRYGLLAVVGLATEDDDGNDATRPGQETAPDYVLVKSLEKTLRAASTVEELAAAAKLVADNRGRLTPDGQAALRSLYQDLSRRLAA